MSENNVMNPFKNKMIPAFKPLDKQICVIIINNPKQDLIPFNLTLDDILYFPPLPLQLIKIQFYWKQVGHLCNECILA